MQNFEKPSRRTVRTCGSAHIYRSGRPALGKRGGVCNTGTKTGGRLNRFTKNQLWLNILIGILIVALVMCLLFAVLLPGCSQVPASVSVAVPVVVLPPSAPESYNKDANSIPQEQYAGTVLGETEDAKDAYVDETLFLGDSNTERMLSYSNVTGVTMNNCIGISSMGITSVPGLRCVRFSGYDDMTIPKAVAVMQPRRVVITFGTNNAGMSTESFIQSYTAAADAIHTAYPYADVIIGSIFPISQNCRYGSISQKGVDEFNLALVKMAQDEGYKFLNWSEALKDTSTGYAKAGVTVSDGVHMSSDAMGMLFSYFRTHSYITEDTRPKPLKDVPRRLPTPEGLFPKPAAPSSVAPVLPSSVSLAAVNVYALSSESGDAFGSAQGQAGGAVTFNVSATPKAGYALPLISWQASAGSVAPSGDTLVVTIPAGHTGDITVWPVFTVAPAVPAAPPPSAAPPQSISAPPSFGQAPAPDSVPAAEPAFNPASQSLGEGAAE